MLKFDLFLTPKTTNTFGAPLVLVATIARIMMESARDEPAADALASLDEYVEHLQACLLQWDPTSDVKGGPKQQFVEALTDIAALPLDSMSMEIRRLLVVHGQRHRPIASDQDDAAVAGANSDENAVSDDDAYENPALLHLLAALRCRDVLLKCKAANAVGSLCISRVAGQQLLDHHGDVLLSTLMKMATCKNKWAQGDAFFVLGWIVVIAEDTMLAPIARLVPSVIRFLHRSVTEDGNGDLVTAPPSEDASNFRIYALVLLLNFMQRDSSAIAAEVQSLMQTLRAIVLKLNRQPVVADVTSNTSTSTSLDPLEFVELLRLTVTFLSLVVDQIPTAAPLVLELTMLPALLKLSHVLQQVQDADLLGGDEQEAADLKTRMDAIIATVLASR